MSTPAGWYPDPTGRHQNRWFDGNDWTDQVADGQVVGSDPVQGGGPDPGATQAVPVPPTQPTVGAPAPPGAPPGSGADPLGGYVSPVADGGGGGSSKVPLIIAAIVVVVLIAAGLVFALGGGDDGGDDTASDSSSEQDQSDDPDEEDDDDPSASDLFDDMADSSGSDDDVFDSDDAPADTVVDGEYPPEVIDNFVNSCVGAGSPESFCNCVIDELQDNVSFDRFAELDRQLAENPDDIPPELTDAAVACQ